MNYKFIFCLQKHMAKFHAEEWAKYKKEINKLQQDLNSKLNDKHLCDICGKEFENAHKLKVSIRKKSFLTFFNKILHNNKYLTN